MLSIVVDAMCAGSIPDVLIVPVGISYDRIIEGNYNSEQLVRVIEQKGGVLCVHAHPTFSALPLFHVSSEGDFPSLSGVSLYTTSKQVY